MPSSRIPQKKLEALLDLKIQMIQADFKFVTFEPIPYNKSAHIMYKTRYVSQIQDLVQLKMPMWIFSTATTLESFTFLFHTILLKPF